MSELTKTFWKIELAAEAATLELAVALFSQQLEILKAKDWEPQFSGGSWSYNGDGSVGFYTRSVADPREKSLSSAEIGKLRALLRDADSANQILQACK